MNVVLIVADDLGWTDLACFGSKLYETPAIDRLARDGMKFTQNYSACTVCSPTRAALLTGRSHHAAGMRGLSNFRTGFPHMLGHVSTRTATMAEVLSDEHASEEVGGEWVSFGFTGAMVGIWVQDLAREGGYADVDLVRYRTGAAAREAFGAEESAAVRAG